MSKPRTTVPIDAMRAYVNRANRVTPDNLADQRRGMNALLEAMLHEADAYKGFGYVRRNPDGDAPAVFVTPDEVQAGKYDETRRRYY